MDRDDCYVTKITYKRHHAKCIAKFLVDTHPILNQVVVKESINLPGTFRAGCKKNKVEAAFRNNIPFVSINADVLRSQQELKLEDKPRNTLPPVSQEELTNVEKQLTDFCLIDDVFSAVEKNGIEEQLATIFSSTTWASHKSDIFYKITMSKQPGIYVLLTYRRGIDVYALTTTEGVNEFDLIIERGSVEYS